MNEESYEKRLQNSLDWANRCSEGQFLLQHFLRVSGFWLPDQDGKRAVALEIIEQVRRNRMGPAILKTMMCKSIDIDEEPEDANEPYNALDADLSQPR